MCKFVSHLVVINQIFLLSEWYNLSTLSPNSTHEGILLGEMFTNPSQQPLTIFSKWLCNRFIVCLEIVWNHINWRRLPPIEVLATLMQNVRCFFANKHVNQIHLCNELPSHQRIGNIFICEAKLFTTQLYHPIIIPNLLELYLLLPFWYENLKKSTIHPTTSTLSPP